MTENSRQETQKDSKLKTPEEQIAYYKSLVTKSKKLMIYYEDEIKKLKKSLAKYEGEEGKVCELLFIFKYDEENVFYFFKNSSDKEEKVTYHFINEKVLSPKSAEEMKSNPSIKTYDYKRDLRSKDEYLTQIINQYEDKMKRIVKENEENENKIKKIKQSNVEINNSYLNDKKIFEENIQMIISNANDSLMHLKNVFSVDLSDDEVKSEVKNKLEENIQNLSKEIKNTWLAELTSFHQKVLNSYLELVFKSLDDEQSKISQKENWQNTIDQLMISHEEEKKKILENIEENKSTIRGLNKRISQLEQEKYNIALEKDTKVESLTKQMNKGINVNYLKNILMSFLMTNDQSIQDGLLPVIYTSLQFSEGEINQVNTTRAKNNSGLLSFFKK